MSESLDAAQLLQEELPQAPFPGGRDGSFRVFFEAAAHAGVWSHAEADTSVEICGVLVGTWANDAAGPYARINAFIRGEAAANKFAEVTFTHDTWAKINQEMDSKYTDQRIVGWYHSHPDFGVFLSERDKFIQEHFFNGPGQVAHVVDPVRRSEGVFAWQQGKITLLPFFWIGARVQASVAAGEEGHQLAPAAPAVAATGFNLSSLVEGFRNVSGYLLAFAFGLLLANYVQHSLNDLDKTRIAQHATANALLFYGYRPGLADELERARNEIMAARAAARDLAQQHLKLLEDPKADQEKWGNILTRLGGAADGLTKARLIYLPSGEDEELLKRKLNELAAPLGGQPRKPVNKENKPAESKDATPEKGKK